MSKREKVFIIIYCLIPILFFLSKWIFINGYDSYDGKITHMAGTPITVIYGDGHGYNTSSGTNYYPYVEYYVDNDTLKTTEKAWSSVFLEEGEEVTILINSNDDSDIKLLTLFNYWIPVYSLVIFLVFGFIGYGIVVSTDQREFLESQQPE
ncbi:MAG: hypothetical protein COA88_02970 [Kordia sp.]|nr:MAG: hypothetical protein COA88_02970 [Kordia sp.]